MKKIFWLLTAVALCFGGVLLYNPPANKVQAADYAQQKKKKTKHNYRAYVSASVTGDQTNPDASLSATYTNQLYRKITAAGLKVSDPFPYYLMAKVNPMWGFGEDSWAITDNYFFTSGNLWVYYGDLLLSDNSFSDYGQGDYRYFSFYGGTKAQKRKKSVYKTYNVTVSGTESNADATAVPYEEIPTLTYYYRKVPISNLKTDNLIDFRIFRKSPASADFSEDQWTPVNYDYFFTNDYLYIPYGSKYSTPGSAFYGHYNNYDYRIFIYSNEKKKKKKLTKQYVKKYQFNIGSGASGADRVATYTDGAYVMNTYYKKLAIPGLKMTNYKNIRVMKKSYDSSTFDPDTWEPGTFQVTNGYIWIDYGYDITDTGVPTTYHDSASGDYRVYVYK